MAKSDWAAVLSILGFLGIGAAGYYVINQVSQKNPDWKFPDIVGWLTNFLSNLSQPSAPSDDTGTGTGTGGTGTGTTQPPPATVPGTVIFGGAGDWGTGRHAEPSVSVAKKLAEQHPSLALFLGDLSYTNAQDFMPVVNVFKTAGIQMLGTQGNHDSGSSYPGTWGQSGWNQSKVIGNVTFIPVNTESSAGAITFCKAELEKARTKWKVVFMHKPIKTMKSNHGADEGNVNSLVPLFKQYGVQLVLGAHNHNYQRFAPVDGTTYIIAGMGGESPYSLSGSGAVKSDAKHYGFVVFSASATSMTGKCIWQDGTVFDTFNVA